MGATAAITAVSAYSAKREGDKADKARKRQGNVADRELLFAQEQYDRYIDIYGPVEEKLGETIAEGPDYERASADAALAFDKSREINIRNMGRYGINPSSKRFEGFEQDYGVQRARGQVDAMNREDDKQWARELAFTQTGRGIPATALAGYSSAAREYGNIAQMYNKSASSAASSAGYWASRGINNSRNNNGGDFYSDGGYGLNVGGGAGYNDYGGYNGLPRPDGAGTVLQN